MKRTTLVLALLSCFLYGAAQTAIDSFSIGPYTVDYIGEGDVKYRLRDNIDLYDFFELKKDTTVIMPITETPVYHAIGINGKIGANRSAAAKEMGIEGVWKQKIGNNLFFNGGLALTLTHTNMIRIVKRDMLEIGVPLQLELGKLGRPFASLYGSFGITPAFFSTTSRKIWLKEEWTDGGDKKSGFLIAPALEFGGNLPIGATLMRIGVYGTYKINCTSGDHNVYTEAGKCFLGAKIGFIL